MLLVASCNILTAQQTELDALIAARVALSEQYRKQDRDYLKAIEILKAVEDSLANQVEPTALRHVYHKLGVNYFYYGDHTPAYKYASRALELHKEVNGEEHIDVIRAYFLLASIYRRVENYNEAVKGLGHGIILMENLIEKNVSQDTIRLIRMYDEYTRLQVILQNNYLALQYWQKSYQFYNKNETKYYRQIKELYEEKARSYFYRQRYESAIEAYNSAINYYKTHEQKNNYYKGLALSYANLGLIHLKTQQYDRAEENIILSIKYYNKQLEQNKKLTLHQYIGLAYNSLFELKGLTKDYKAANFYYKKALKHALLGWGNIYNNHIATIFRDQAKILIIQNRYKEALNLNNKSLHSLLPSLKDSSLLLKIILKQHPIKNKLSFLQTLHQRANLLYTSYQQDQKNNISYLQTAFHHYQTMDTVITQIRQSYNAKVSQFDLIEQSYPIYDQAIGVAMELYQQTNEVNYLKQAYHFAAKNKALVLLDGMQTEKAKQTTIPAALRQEEKQLKRSIFELEGKLYELGEKGDARLKDSLFYLQRAHEKLNQQLESEYTDYYEAKYGFTKNIAIHEIQQQLNSSTAVLEYFVGQTQVYVFMITAQSFKCISMDKTTDLEEKIIAFRKLIETKALVNDTFIEQSHALYQNLAADALEQLPTNINTLHIVLDPMLMQLPFDALIQDVRTAQASYLVYDYAIAYAYSNQLLFGQQQGRAAKLFAGYGLEYDEYTLNALDQYLKEKDLMDESVRSLGKLLYSDDEIKALSELLGGDSWLNEAATKNAFLEEIENYNLIHLATHGLLNEDYPLNSALVFNRSNDSSDFLLRAADVYNMELQADMVVLSACNTAAGAVHKGEGVRSLARAFAHAGCPSLVASLWNAADKPTKELIVDFYTNLQAGQNKAQALQQAKLKYLQNAPPVHQLPFYWSHLNIIGDASELSVLQRSNKLYYYVAGGALLLLAIWGIKRLNN